MAGLGASAPRTAGCLGRPTRLPGKAAEMKVGELLSPNVSYQLAKKASPRQSCLTIKGERLREQLSSLAGECGHEVRGEGALGRGIPESPGLPSWAALLCCPPLLPSSACALRPPEPGAVLSLPASERGGEMFIGVSPAVVPRPRGAAPRAGSGRAAPRRSLPARQRPAPPAARTAALPPPAALLAAAERGCGRKCGSSVSQGPCRPLPRANQLRGRLTHAAPVLQKLKQTSDESTVQKSDLLFLYWLQGKH